MLGYSRAYYAGETVCGDYNMPSEPFIKGESLRSFFCVDPPFLFLLEAVCLLRDAQNVK